MRTAIPLIILVGCIGVGIYWLAQSADPIAKQQAPHETDQIIEPVTVSKGGDEPDRYSGFAEMTQQKKLGLITKHMHATAITKAERDFLIKELGNKELLDVTRNNIANTLAWQKHIDPRLPGLLSHFAKDPNEDMTWREYATQFLGEIYPRADQRSIINELWSLTEVADGAIAATAMLQLSVLHRQQRAELPGQYLSRASAMATSGGDLRTRMTAIGILGHLNHVDALRKNRDNISDIGALRATIASFGLAGSSDKDLPYIKKYIDHPNKAVAMAAQAAAERLAKR